MRALMFAVSLCVFIPAAAFAQSQLDSPAPGSKQSGQGVIYGWVCTATTVEIVVDGTIRVQAPYGTLRGDTQTACGDVNNGFAFGVNWNELGDGTHSLVVLADGNQFAQATFTVQTLGAPVLTGAAGSYQLQGFVGKTVTVEWSEPLQNFVITGWTASGGEGPPPSRDFTGNWFFQANLAQNTCPFLGPNDVPFHVETTLGVTQTGTSLSIRSGSLTLTGNVESNADFVAVGTPTVDTSGTCTFSIGGGYAGNFALGTAVFALIADRVGGTCAIPLPCQVAWGGTIVKNALSTAPDQDLDEMIEAVRGAIQRHE